MIESIEQEIRTLRSIFWSGRDPEGRAFVPLADAYRRAGDFREAAKLLTEGLKRHPDFTSGHLVAAQLYHENGLSEEALLAFRRVLELDPDNVMALELLAEALDAQGAVAEAVDLRKRHGALTSVEPEPEPEPEPAIEMEAEAADEPVVELPELPELPAAEPESEPEPEPAMELEAEVADEPVVELPELPELPAEPEAEAEPEPEPEPEPEAVVELEAEAPEEPVMEMEAEAPDEPVMEMEALAPDEPVMEMEALAPDEPVMEMEALAPDEPVVEMEALAPDEPVVEAEALAPDEPVVEIEALAPDDDTTPDGAVDDIDQQPMVTRTMAELFAAQGMADRALEIYRQLLEAAPADRGLLRRIAELSVGLEEPGGAAASSAEESRALGGVRQQEDDLSGHAWDAGAQADPHDVETPFAWTQEDAEEVSSEGPPVSTYFTEMLGWEPGSAPAGREADAEAGEDEVTDWPNRKDK